MADAEASHPKHVRPLIEMLREHWVFILSTSEGPDAPPYCTPLFYAAVGPTTFGQHDAPILIFASARHSHHGQALGDGPTAVGGGLYLETEEQGIIRGVQFRGRAVCTDSLTPSIDRLARECYLKRHAVAASMLDQHCVWLLGIEWAKRTDNRIGFGVHPEDHYRAPLPFE